MVRNDMKSVNVLSSHKRLGIRTLFWNLGSKV